MRLDEFAPVGGRAAGRRDWRWLARLFAKPTNLIVLDEPTNDLDAETLELLEERLEDFAEAFARWEVLDGGNARPAAAVQKIVPATTSQGQSVSRKTVAEVPLTGLSLNLPDWCASVY